MGIYLVRSFGSSLVDTTGSLYRFWRKYRMKVDKNRRQIFDGILIYFWWNIWRERNRRVFQQKFLSPRQVVMLCKDDIFYFDNDTLRASGQMAQSRLTSDQPCAVCAPRLVPRAAYPARASRRVLSTPCASRPCSCLAPSAPRATLPHATSTSHHWTTASR
jgi:hypothetical protein